MDENFPGIKLDDNNLNTSIWKIMPPQPELEASGKILAQNKIILQRLFERMIASESLVM